MEWKQTDWRIFLFYAVILPFFVVAGVVFMGMGIRDIRMSRESSTWPATTAEIVQATIASSTSTRRHITTYSPRVVYRYKVDGVEYTANRISFGSTRSGESLAEEYRRLEYKEGDVVGIRYDPKNPKEAVIEAGFSRDVYLVFLAGLTIFWAAAGWAAFSGLSVLMGEKGERTVLVAFGIYVVVFVGLIVLCWRICS